MQSVTSTAGLLCHNTTNAIAKALVAAELGDGSGDPEDGVARLRRKDRLLWWKDAGYTLLLAIAGAKDTEAKATEVLAAVWEVQHPGEVPPPTPDLSLSALGLI